MIAKPSRLLVVDDEVSNRVVLSYGLKGRGYAVDMADGGPEALDKILREPYDLIVLDQMMPGMSGLALLRLLRATYSQSELPVIMVTGLEQNEIMMSALSQGANDFVLKPVEMLAMTARIEAQLFRARADRELREREMRYSPADLKLDGGFDLLTGLSNRLTLWDHIIKGLAGTRCGEKHHVALLLLDLDGFKEINGSLGHAAGDRLLIEVAARLREVVASSRFAAAATVARLREDEFVVLIEAPQDAEETIAFASAVLDSLKRPVSVHGLPVTVSACVGVVLSEPEMSPSQLLRDADLAVDRAKSLGKNRLHLFDPSLRARARGRMATAIDLRHAVKRHELLAVYQPKVNLRTRTIAGFEALLRWQHPERGLLRPGDFIAVAEETGLIVSIGEWILERACHQLTAWQKRFSANPPLTMSVNLSVKQLAHPDLLPTIRRILAETAIAPETLKLELTESTFMNEVESARTILSEMRNLGVGLQLDDFGTGYSSLSCLSTTHFDALKIDKSFVDRLATDADSQAIVKTIISLAKALNMGVVAEGIETEPQLGQLIGLGCEAGQGFLFSEPVVAEAAEGLLRDTLRRNAAA